MNRQEHLQWCKDRALEILDKSGDPGEAYISFCGDMGKHHETADHPAIQMGVMMMLSGFNNTPHEMRKYINGFN